MGYYKLDIDGGDVSSEGDLSAEGREGDQDGQGKSEDRELKDKLLRKFGDRIGSLKLGFSKKKKKGKLPKEARQALVDWWILHYKWPYPTVNSLIMLAVSLYHIYTICIFTRFVFLSK